MKRFVILSVIISLIFVSGEWFNSAKFRLAANISGIAGFFIPNKELKDRIIELETENADLKAAAFLKEIEEPGTFKVHSFYPFNNSREIAIAAGADSGIKEGDIVVVERNILVGKIKKVFGRYSIATTLHDPGWEMAVRIGLGETDGLFKGGNKLNANLIPGTSLIQVGDNVITSGVNFPYGLFVGKVLSIEDELTGHFKTAVIEPAVALNNLKNVSIRSK